MIQSIIRNGVVVFVCILFIGTLKTFAQADSVQAAKNPTPVGTSKIWGQVNGINIEGMVQGPATEVAPLQVACVFEYTEGDIYNSPPALPAASNGMVHLDKALN